MINQSKVMYCVFQLKNVPCFNAEGNIDECLPSKPANSENVTRQGDQLDISEYSRSLSTSPENVTRHNTDHTFYIGECFGDLLSKPTSLER